MLKDIIENIKGFYSFGGINVESTVHYPLIRQLDVRKVVLHEDIVITVFAGKGVLNYTFNDLEEFNGASNPRIFWPIATPFGKHTLATFFHDRGYERKYSDLSRQQIDQIFYALMDKADTDSKRAKIMFFFVRTFSWLFYYKPSEWFGYTFKRLEK